MTAIVQLGYLNVKELKLLETEKKVRSLGNKPLEELKKYGNITIPIVIMQY